MINIDAIIVVLYLICTLYIGIKYGKGTRTIQDFALGGRNFSTATLAATITATYISGGTLVTGIQYAYIDGLLKFFTSIGIGICLFFIGTFFVPRMKEFLGKLSVADLMGGLYGKNVQIITAITGFISSVGMIAVQIKIISFTLSYFSNIDTNTSVLFSAFILIIYSTFGGIRAVTFTDVVQFVTFFIIMPSIAIAIFKIINFEADHTSLQRSIEHMLSLKNNSGTDYTALFFYVLIPTLEPSLIQRILMGRSVFQVKKAFQISSIMYLFYCLVPLFIGVMIYGHNSNLDYNRAFSYMVDHFTSPGIKGIVFISVLAMAMSTADSHLNASSVLFSHDFCKPLNIVKTERGILLSSRIFTLIIGVLATILAMNFHNLISMLLFVNNFYKPIVSVPLILAILGFRSTTKSVLIGMCAGFSTVVIWKSYQMFNPGILNLDSLIPATFANLVFFLGSHYFLKQNGGWIGPLDISPLQYIRTQRQESLIFLKNKIHELGQAFTLPMSNKLAIKTSDSMYFFLGIIILLSYITIKVSSNSVVIEKFEVLNQIITLLIGALMMTRILWKRILPETLSSFIILMSICYLLFFTIVMTFIYGFANITIICVITNILISSLFLEVISTILLSIFSILIAILYYKILYGDLIFSKNYDEISASLYVLFVLSTTFLLFFRQQKKELVIFQTNEQRLLSINEMMNAQLDIKEANLKRSMDMQKEIFRNINHELKTPISTLISNVDLLEEVWRNPKRHNNISMEELIPGIIQSGRRFYDYANNLIDLSMFQTNKMLFDIKKDNLKNLLVDISKEHKNVLLTYSEDLPDHIEFDRIKLRKAINKIIDNANKFSDHGDIEIIVTKSYKGRRFDDKEYECLDIRISDVGIGIPEEELGKIFETFYESSRTRQISGGKGLGLAVAKEIVNGHMGRIYAANNFNIGVSITITLPFIIPRAKFLAGMQDNIDMKPIDLKILLNRAICLDKHFNGRMPKILMVDDEKVVLESCALMLKSLGFEFKGIAYGSEAIEYINSKEFEADLIFLDVMLVDMSGLDVLEAIAEKIKRSRTKLVIQSGLGEDDPLITQMRDIVMSEFIGKPYNKTQLDAVINKVLGIQF